MVIFYVLWNQLGMAKKIAPAGIAIDLYQRIRALKPDGMSYRDWCERGEVSTSFFTDVRKGTIPSIDKIERMVNAAGMSLVEFVSDGEGRKGFSEQQLRQALENALPIPDGSLEWQAEYLSGVVLDMLGLPPSRPSTPPSRPNDGPVVRAKGAPAPASTKRT